MSEQTSNPAKMNALSMEFFKMSMLAFPALPFIFWSSEWGIMIFRWFVLLPIPTLWYVSYWYSYGFYCIAVAVDTAVLSTTGGWSREKTARWLIDASHYFYCGFPRSLDDELPGCPDSSSGRVVAYTAIGACIAAFCYIFSRQNAAMGSFVLLTVPISGLLGYLFICRTRPSENEKVE